ncbi:MAG TPA: DUF5703 domain-containing protein, partial [Puia sp.]|nr:DUF5703 domain-containing protein [Puia sp.]
MKQKILTAMILHKPVFSKYLLLLMIGSIGLMDLVQAQTSTAVGDYNLIWNEPGVDENSSMPLGNGDIALNAWTEQNGDIVLLLAKADAWSESAQMLKLGRVRISLSPNPFLNSTVFSQTLRLDNGSLEIASGNNLVRVWVDANHPVVRVTAKTEKPVLLKAVSEIWRTSQYHLTQKQIGEAPLAHWEWASNPAGLDFYPDTVLPSGSKQVSWCHFNSTSLYSLSFEREHLGSLVSKYPDPLMHRCFGVVMKGKGLVKEGNLALASSTPSTAQQLNIYALTEQTTSPVAWLEDIDKKIKAVETIKVTDAWKVHVEWWTAFWNRSWINITGAGEAGKVAQGYAMQRFMTACAGRGKYPIKYNGSLFTVGHDLPPDSLSNDLHHDADYRRWGSCYWNQNVRHVYWPLIASGDYDMLMPWFNMYVNALPLAKDRTRLYYHHNGASFIETMLFWGLPNANDFGWDNPGADPESPYMRYHVQGGLEVTAQMLDYYDNTQDNQFLQKSLLPFADAILTYYAEHWPRGEDGKIIFSPAQSIETYQLDAVNPTPDIAGLRSILPRLLHLPATLTTEKQRSRWSTLEKEIPALPMGTTAKSRIPPGAMGEPEGDSIILPAQHYGPTKNVENPELYTVFPYRLYELGKP